MDQTVIYTKCGDPVSYTHLDSVPLEILGQDEVTGLKIRNIKTNEERELTADGVFIAVGIVPNTTLVKDQLKLDENGYICAGEELSLIHISVRMQR